MKKGFLFGPPTKSPKVKGQQKAKSSDSSKQDNGSMPTKDYDDIPLIKPKGDGGQGVAERIPGFMESVRAGLPDLKNQGDIRLIDYVICNIHTVHFTFVLKKKTKLDLFESWFKIFTVKLNQDVIMSRKWQK